jgi:hypothetical protein
MFLINDTNKFVVLTLHSLNDFVAYGQSKLANILHSNELSRILKVSQAFVTE